MIEQERQDERHVKKLWIIHHYATLPNLNGHIRPYRFAKYLKRHNIDTTIFASSYQHFSEENLITDGKPYIEKAFEGVPFVFINTPSIGDGYSRIRNMFAFYIGLMKNAKQYINNHGKPDIIIASSPQPLGMIAGVRLAKKFGVPCICEVRDLWPEAIFSATGIKAKSLLGMILTAGEHWIYKHSTAMIFTKEGDVDYLKERGWTTSQNGDIDLKKCFYINNGVDLDSYMREMTENSFSDEDLDAETFRVIYAGAIRSVNNIGNIIDAAKLITNPKIQFLIYGDGSKRPELEERVRAEGVSNVKFKGFVEKKYLPYILSRASVNLLNYSDSKYNWSRGSSSNKLFEYMASGKPVIATFRMGYSIINRYHCGVELNACTPEDMAKAIEAFIRMPEEEYNAFCVGAVRGAKDFDYAILSEKLYAILRAVTEPAINTTSYRFHLSLIKRRMYNEPVEQIINTLPYDKTLEIETNSVPNQATSAKEKYSYSNMQRISK